jgi:hypothetical protein
VLQREGRQELLVRVSRGEEGHEKLMGEMREARQQQQLDNSELKRSLALQGEEGQATLARVNRGEEQQEKLNGEIREAGQQQQEDREQQTRALARQREEGQAVLDLVNREIRGAKEQQQGDHEQQMQWLVREREERQALHERVSRGEEGWGSFNGEIWEQLRQSEDRTKGLERSRAVHSHYLHERLNEQSCKLDEVERAVGTTSSEIVEVRGALHEAESALYVNFSELRGEVAEGLETQRQATEVIKTAERELQGKTGQELAVLKEALRREQARREEWERTLHGELATDARRQDLATEALAAGVAQHEVLLQGAAGAMNALQNNGAAQATALASMGHKLAATLLACEEQAQMVRALADHGRATDARMAELYNRTQAAERDARGADCRAEHWAKCADDVYQEMTRRQDRQANSITTNRESCSRAEQGVAILMQYGWGVSMETDEAPVAGAIEEKGGAATDLNVATVAVVGGTVANECAGFKVEIKAPDSGEDRAPLKEAMAASGKEEGGGVAKDPNATTVGVNAETDSKECEGVNVEDRVPESGKETSTLSDAGTSPGTVSRAPEITVCGLLDASTTCGATPEIHLPVSGTSLGPVRSAPDISLLDSSTSFEVEGSAPETNLLDGLDAGTTSGVAPEINGFVTCTSFGVVESAPVIKLPDSGNTSGAARNAPEINLFDWSTSCEVEGSAPETNLFDVLGAGTTFGAALDSGSTFGAAENALEINLSETGTFLGAAGSAKTGEVLRGAATTISAVLRIEGAPPLAASADEQGTSTNASVAGAKTVTPANECTGVKVECKALGEEGTLVKGCVLPSPEAPGEESTPSPVGEGLPPTHAAANSCKEDGSAEGNEGGLAKDSSATGGETSIAKAWWEAAEKVTVYDGEDMELGQGDQEAGMLNPDRETFFGTSASNTEGQGGASAATWPSLPGSQKLTTKKPNTTKTAVSFRDACKGASSNPYTALGKDAEDGALLDHPPSTRSRDVPTPAQSPPPPLQDARLDLLNLLNKLRKRLAARPASGAVDQESVRKIVALVPALLESALPEIYGPALAFALEIQRLAQEAGVETEQLWEKKWQGKSVPASRLDLAEDAAVRDRNIREIQVIHDRNVERWRVCDATAQELRRHCDVFPRGFLKGGKGGYRWKGASVRTHGGSAFRGATTKPPHSAPGDE